MKMGPYNTIPICLPKKILFNLGLDQKMSGIAMLALYLWHRVTFPSHLVT